MSNITKSKSINILSRPVWLDAAGMSKGINHDRQHLGIILAAGQAVRIRQTNAAFNEILTMRLLNDDCKTEAEYLIGSTWVEASLNAASVPFIDTPYVDGMPVVEFEYPDTAKTLPVYRKGENEVAFFSRWDTQDAEFGFIESEYANLLVPKISKKELKALGEAKNIDGLIAYYEGIFTFYNALAGISFEPERDSDRNIKNRYFIKADKNGAGAAYYGVWWTAETSSSISSFWLTPEDSNWGSLHEIAHGYQGYFTEDKYLSTGEMWNNIYAACYQDVLLGDRKYEEGWLYDYGNMEKVENNIIDLIATATPLNQWDQRSMLYFAVLMVDKAGKNAFTYFNQQYRKSCNTSGFVPSDHALLDMLSESFAAAGEQVDVTPFIQLTGGYVTQTQCNRNVLSDARAVYPLYKLVDEPQLEAVRNQLKLDSSLRLVDATQLKACGLKGNVSLCFNIDDFAQIYGEDLILMEGRRYAYKTRINIPTMELSELPIGVYSLRLPTGKDHKYQPMSGYLVVKQGDNVAEILFVKKVSSPIVSQEINLLGLGDKIFATLLVDCAQGKLVIDVTTTTPHAYFPGVTYARIIVRDPQGNLIFSKDIHGTDASLSHDELAFSEGDQIEIYHEEPDRVRVNPAYPGIIDNKNKTNVLTIDNSGLKNVALQGDPEQALLARLQSAVVSLRGYPQAYYAFFTPFKDDIYLAINTFSSPQREQLLASYKDCIPAVNTPPSDYAGNEFTLAFRGISDRQFLTGTLNLVVKTLTVKIEAGIAHDYFPGVYASLEYEDADGNILYHDEVIGNQTQQMRSVELPLSGYGGEVIRLYHEEPDNRLIITNDMREVQLAEKGKQQNYRITTVGLERIVD
ncbi:peptidase M60 viral enhancin protein [Citrobacter amalonaticus]|uniref:Peptidase M60 viral enhancin protein n=1 Tax=Citrobacter amalonaticus TaxID=35703 RepID=A0A2S4S145_CITAM|nr:putative mucin/carbohydrate-binding domain-containing protein [Citrobacter amalonaticus]POT55259.1 peptidase M60 viral enhancin protein [Citrobacter amalonaticus]POT77133.1 peptidase M60 viral enhancin protein [Citrobacter amalonaticus]POU67584.1 peptidase M60 viral enhancin protein [Citrobacter amalonaticus]POV07189.1 peptidase M60 viral enhancin protein [Citrobacter amalonaticus]